MSLGQESNVGSYEYLKKQNKIQRLKAKCCDTIKKLEISLNVINIPPLYRYVSYQGKTLATCNTHKKVVLHMYTSRSSFVPSFVDIA